MCAANSCWWPSNQGCVVSEVPVSSRDANSALSEPKIGWRDPKLSTPRPQLMLLPHSVASRSKSSVFGRQIRVCVVEKRPVAAKMAKSELATGPKSGAPRKWAGREFQRCKLARFTAKKGQFGAKLSTPRLQSGKFRAFKVACPKWSPGGQ